MIAQGRPMAIDPVAGRCAVSPGVVQRGMIELLVRHVTVRRTRTARRPGGSASQAMGRSLVSTCASGDGEAIVRRRTRRSVGRAELRARRARSRRRGLRSVGDVEQGSRDRRGRAGRIGHRSCRRPAGRDDPRCRRVVTTDCGPRPGAVMADRASVRAEVDSWAAFWRARWSARIGRVANAASTNVTAMSPKRSARRPPHRRSADDHAVHATHSDPTPNASVK